jgi:hypothetical protein
MNPGGGEPPLPSSGDAEGAGLRARASQDNARLEYVGWRTRGGAALERTELTQEDGGMLPLAPMPACLSQPRTTRLDGGHVDRH